MTHIITEPCIGCKNTICVTVCPVDAFREDTNCLWIDPEACIDCGACVPECPVEAIYTDRNVPDKWQHYIALNQDNAAKCPVITEQKEPLSS